MTSFKRTFFISPFSALVLVAAIKCPERTKLDLLKNSNEKLYFGTMYLNFTLIQFSYNCGTQKAVFL